MKPTKKRSQHLPPHPDPAGGFDRASPHPRSSEGRAGDDIEHATPVDQPDAIADAVHNQQSPAGQLTTDDTGDTRTKAPPLNPPPVAKRQEERLRG